MLTGIFELRHFDVSYVQYVWCFIFEASSQVPKSCLESWPVSISCSDLPSSWPTSPPFASNAVLAISPPSDSSSQRGRLLFAHRRPRECALLSICFPCLKLKWWNLALSSVDLWSYTCNSWLKLFMKWKINKPWCYIIAKVGLDGWIDGSDGSRVGWSKQMKFQ